MTRGFFPKLFEITAEDRRQAIRWAAATATAKIGHADAVPVITRMLSNPDPYIAFAGAEAMGDTSSRDAVPMLISAIPSAIEDNKLKLHAIIEELTRLTHQTTAADPAARIGIYQKWLTWWSVHHHADIHAPDDCGVVTNSLEEKPNALGSIRGSPAHAGPRVYQADQRRARKTLLAAQ